ncbi:MAG: response regulator [bacterium]|nr:response regulator [bacterium]
MARVLILHPERAARKTLEQHAGQNHQVTTAPDVRAAFKALAKTRPALVVAGLNGKRRDALEFLGQLKREGNKQPTIVVASDGGGLYEPLAMKLGAAAFLEYPVEQLTLDRAISKVLTADYSEKGDQPPVTDEERNANLTDLEADLNHRMKCFAGKNLVYLQSFILGGGRTSKPRIALKCPLRQEYGDPPNVYYEYIRDVCCSNPEACSAHQTFKKRHTA